MTQVLLTMYRAIREGHLDVVSDDIKKLTGRAAKLRCDTDVRAFW